MFRMNARRHPQDQATLRLIRRLTVLFALVGAMAMVLGLLSACLLDHPSTDVGELAAYAHRGAWTGCVPGPLQARGALLPTTSTDI
jgi:hypothetical protein